MQTSESTANKPERPQKPKCECLVYRCNRRCRNNATSIVRLSGAHEPYRMCTVHSRPYMGKAGIVIQPIAPS